MTRQAETDTWEWEASAKIGRWITKTRRVERFIRELSLFVTEPGVQADNCAAELSLCHLSVGSKVSGGPRLARGADGKMTIASLFDTWHAREVSPGSSASTSSPLNKR